MNGPFDQPVLWHFGSIPIAESVVTTWGIIVVLVAISALAVRRRRNAVGVVELAVTTIENELRDVMRRDPAPFLPLCGTLFLYLLFANLASLIPGIHSPTARLETAAALATIVFVAVRFYGIRDAGLWGHLRTYAQPSLLALPLNIIGDLTRTLALVVRLFGNIMSGQFLIAVVIAFAGLLVPIPLMALSIVVGVVQAYIFTILAAVFIAAGMGSLEEHMPKEDS